jgi:hypothetical protein
MGLSGDQLALARIVNLSKDDRPEVGIRLGEAGRQNVYLFIYLFLTS